MTAADMISNVRKLNNIDSPPRRAKRTSSKIRVTKQRTTQFWNRQFNYVVEWLEDTYEGFEVILEAKSQDRLILGEEKTIYINSTKHAESRFYTLLHELGHVLIRTGHQWKEFCSYYPGYDTNPEGAGDGRVAKSKSYRVAEVAEELEAWRVGLQFTRDHKLFVNPLKYDADASEALLCYIKWTSAISAAQAQAGKKAAVTRRRLAQTSRTQVSQGSNRRIP